MKTADLLETCRQHGLLIGVAESCTGGLLAALLTQTPGASDVFQGGFVTYSNTAKERLLGVHADTLGRFGAVSEPVAREMAKGVLARLPVDLAVSITGIAGPGGSEHKPEGRVCFGLCQGKQAHAETLEFGALGRENVRLAARDHAVKMLYMAAQGQVFT